MLRLNDYLPYLINRVSPPIAEGFAEDLAEAGVSLQMWRVLAVLYEYGDQSVGALAELTSINVSTLSRLVGRMGREGLVARRRDGEDARSVTVHLLKPGLAATEKLIPKALAYEAALTRNFSASELKTFKALLIKFYADMERRDERWEEAAEARAGSGDRDAARP